MLPSFHRERWAEPGNLICLPKEVTEKTVVSKYIWRVFSVGLASFWLDFIGEKVIEKTISPFFFCRGMGTSEGDGRGALSSPFAPRTPGVLDEVSLGAPSTSFLWVSGPRPSPYVYSWTCAMEWQNSSVLSPQKLQMRLRKLTKSGILKGLL